MFFSRKGVSPLIATILLVAVSLVIGAMVFSFSTQFTTKGITQARQSGELQLTCQSSGFMVNSCARSNYTFTIDLKNTGTIDLNGFDVSIQYTDGNIARLDTNESLRDSLIIDFNGWTKAYLTSTPAIKELFIKPKICPDIAITKTSCP